MKNYLIIGASSGIGESLSQRLSKQHQVWGSYWKHPKDDEKIQYFYYDVLSKENIDFSIPDVLDGFVYCPGSINLKPFNRISGQEFSDDFELQFLGMVKALQKVLPNLKKSTSASIILFSTVAVKSGFPFHTMVSASKGAIEGFAKALAAEVAPKIRVNVIAPSLTQTPLANNLLSTPEKIEANAGRHPLKRIGSSDEIAAMAEFLLNDDASWITGQVFHVDGGMSSLRV